MIRKYFYIFLTFILFSCNQPDADIKLYIDAWKVDDKFQTVAAEGTYYLMRSNDNLVVEHTIEKCEKYIEKNPDERLRLRLEIFKALYVRDKKVLPDTNDYNHMLQILPDCLKFGDDQITAEVYAILSDVSGRSKFISYVLKATDMMEKIGVQYFPRYNQRLNSIAFTLYLNQEYRQSLTYLQKAMKFANNDMDYLYNPSYVLVNDLAGACYMELEMYDSSLIHHKLQLQNLNLPYNQKYPQVQLWHDIATGNIAYLNSLKGATSDFLPYILKHRNSSLKGADYNNVAIVENRIGEMYMKNGFYDKSIHSFHNAIYFSRRTPYVKQRKIAAKGLAEIYRLSNNADSVYKYFSLYKTYEDTINSAKLSYNLGTAKARVAFESSESNLRSANKDIKQQRLFRNFIIIFILLISIIAFQYYSRNMLEQKSRAAKLEDDKYKALNDVEKAREELNIFKQRIIEKEAMISKLHSHILDKDEMEKFNFEFEIAHPSVMPRLNVISKPLSPAEKRLAALIYLQLNNEQIGHALGISKDSVARSKRRLKQTLNLSQSDNLELFILGK